MRASGDISMSGAGVFGDFSLRMDSIWEIYGVINSALNLRWRIR